MEARASRRVLLLAAAIASSAAAWPSDLLKNECEKGELLVAGDFAPPPIMGAMPELDASMLSVRMLTVDGEPDSEAELQDGATVAAGDALELKFVSRRESPLNVHLVFITSSGEMANGQPCGQAGARLHCTTCGENPGWLNRVIWTAGEPGSATLAVGAARGGYGTPAVRVAMRSVNVTARADGLREERGEVVAHQPPTTRSWLAGWLFAWSTTDVASVSCGERDG
jgi:hypothetical protein